VPLRRVVATITPWRAGAVVPADGFDAAAMEGAVEATIVVWEQHLATVEHHGTVIAQAGLGAPYTRAFQASPDFELHVAMYVCPDCRAPLSDFFCANCRVTYDRRDDIPILLPSDPRFKSVVELAATYDSIYREHSDVWENQGRTPQFHDYFASLLGQFPCTRFLEIGCGEGFLLGRLANGERFATDLSIEVLSRARKRTSAHLSVAVAERLPFPSDHFDLVTSVGVMEHFIDIDEAISEIRRVLRPGGYYVSYTHVDLTFGERLRQKMSDYVFPHPRPLQLARWIGTRLRPAAKPELVNQPIQNRYTTRDAKTRLQRNRLRVVDVFHSRRRPHTPLVPGAVVYVAERHD
jgi:SAM-dependent methyltransferase